MTRARMGILLLLALTAAPGAWAQESSKSEAKERLDKVESALDDWDVPGARRELTELERLVPEGVEPLKYFQGRVAFEEGKYPEAVELLQQAHIEDKPGSYLRLAKDTRDITQKHLHVESEHFVFYYPPGKDEVLAPYALETLEAIHKALAADLGYEPPGKVRVEVVNNARELSKVSTLTYQQIQTTGTIAICKFNKLMVTSPKAVARGYDWQDTLAHEYIHLVVSQMSHNTVPIWLHEGLAKFLESRWRGKPGLAMTPSTLALLGRRVKEDKLIPFEKMHPSIAMLPTAEDAATAFAEVYFAMDYVYTTRGNPGLRDIILGLRDGKTDKKSVEGATGLSFGQFEKSWLAHIKQQRFPQELLPPDEVVLKENAKDKDEKKKGREISFGDFAEVTEIPARKSAHLGELMRERNRIRAAAEEYARAHQIVGDKYESVSNKYALALLELRRLDEAEQVLRGSLRMHPGIPATNVHLGRIFLHREDYPNARRSYLDALSADPFDPEIHIALTRIHGALGETALANRTKAAGAALTGMTQEEIGASAKAFLRDDAELVTAGDVGSPAEEAKKGDKPSPAAQDAGR